MFRVVYDKKEKTWIAVEANPQFKGRVYEQSEAQQVADQRNQGTTYECIECHAHFSVTDDEVKWYEDRHFVLPKRCPACRHKRRMERTSQEEQVQQ